MFISAWWSSLRRVRLSHDACLIRFGALVLCWQMGSPVAAEGEPAEEALAHSDSTRVQRFVDDYVPRLGLSAQVEVVVVPRNELMVSVEPVDGQARFRLSLEQSFLRELSDDELGATVAHELGHVWIFTHHPFLQTEAGANDVAMRLVPKEALVRVYERVYQRLGTKGSLARFVGD